MKLRQLLPILALLSIATAHAAEEDGPPAKRPGLFNRLLHPFGGGKPKAKVPGQKGKLALELKLEPQPLKLSDTNRLKVTLVLINRTKKLAQLDFPTSQRIEVLLKTSAGKLVEQWSQDQAFNNDPAILTINSGERLEYQVEVATRDLMAGESYQVQGFFPQHEDIHAEKTFVPQK